MQAHFAVMPGDRNVALNAARETALHVAVRTSQASCVAWLLALERRENSPGQARAKLSVFDARNRTPLHYAAYYKVRDTYLFLLHVLLIGPKR